MGFLNQPWSRVPPLPRILVAVSNFARYFILEQAKTRPAKTNVGAEAKD